MLRIFVQTNIGERFLAFHWSRTAINGCERAIREGKEFGHNVIAAWAVNEQGKDVASIMVDETIPFPGVEVFDLVSIHGGLA
jgi:hypothetical protein